jgi:PAS domain S-box-containing protein
LRKDIFVRYIKNEIGKNENVIKKNSQTESDDHHEKLLKEYAMLLANISEAVISTDLQFVIQTWNCTAELMYGWKKEEVIGKYLGAYVKPKYPNDSKEKVINDFMNKGSWNGEVLHQTKSGSTIWIHGSVSMIKDNDGKPIGAVSVNRNITIQKKMEKNLQDSEQKYRNLFENSITAVTVTRIDGEIVEANPTMKNLIKVDDISNHNIKEFYANIEDRQRMLVQFKKEGKINDFELEIKDTKGKQKWLSLSGIQIEFQGKPALLITAVEITNRKISQLNLVENEKKFRSVFENNPDAIFWGDPETGLIINCNPSAEMLMGYTRDEIIGLHQSKLHPPQFKSESIDIFKGDFEHKGGQNINFEIINKSGKIIPVQINSSVFEVNGKKILQGNFRNMTVQKIFERKLIESEQKYRDIIEQSMLGILIHIDDKIILANDAWINIVGQSKENIMNYSLSSFMKNIHLDDVLHIQEEIQKQSKDPTYIIDCEYRLKTIKKGYIWIHQISKTLSINNEFAVHTLIMDITNNRKLEEERNKSQKIKSIGLLASGIAHDFNNILVAVMGNADLLDLTNLNKEQADYVRNLREVGIQARDLTRQLLTFSKGGKPIRKPTEIKKILIESVEMAKKGTSSTYDINDNSIHRNVFVDTGQISQVFNNLFINAIQSMNNNGLIAINISSEVIESHSVLKNGSYIRIDITDQGEGISEQNKPNIFSPYFTTKTDGSGLGLVTCFSIIKQHDGYITFKSKIKKGTTFIVYLPISRISPSKVMKESYNISHIKKILVLEDNQHVIKTIERLCETLSIKVDCTTNGTNTIELYKKALSINPYDAVVLDIIVPMSMNGDEVLEKLLTIDPNVKAIMSSGFMKNSLISNYKERGFKVLLQKPYSREEFKKALSNI